MLVVKETNLENHNHQFLSIRKLNQTFLIFLVFSSFLLAHCETVSRIDLVAKFACFNLSSNKTY